MKSIFDMENFNKAAKDSEQDAAQNCSQNSVQNTEQSVAQNLSQGNLQGSSQLTDASKFYDAIVVGSGHAGVESASALAKLGLKTLMLTLNLDSIAFLACNPSIGGTSKGQLVSEIDALGGVMGVMADKSTLQRRMLNRSKGPAVQSLRTQTDKIEYHKNMKEYLENLENLFIKEAEVSDFIVNEGALTGIITDQGEKYFCNVAVVCTGVYLCSQIIIGEYIKDVGPNGFSNATKLTRAIENLGHSVRRFKTGTPVRVHKDSIDLNMLEVQKGEDDIQCFSYMTKEKPKNILDCYLTYTTEKTHKYIMDNLDKAPMYAGTIKGTGARYCPSIEDKVVRFADKNRHQLFVEPEALSTKEMYLQGFSTSMPAHIQENMVRSLPGFENAHIMRNAYAIEYDCIDSLQLLPTLQSKLLKGLFFAGQINGTSGYEEAAAQGIIAGINAANVCLGKSAFIIKRSEGYIGVLVDDLVTKGTNEPYRMMTSRAEYRLNLRQDNADLRLTARGREVGLVDDERWERYQRRVSEIDEILFKLSERRDTKTLRLLFDEKNEVFTNTCVNLKEALKRNNITIEDVVEHYGAEFSCYEKENLKQAEIAVKYEGYLLRQSAQIKQSLKSDEMVIPNEINYEAIKGLRIEARQKLQKIMPHSIGQASRISGVSPADIAVLLVYLKLKFGKS